MIWENSGIELIGTPIKIQKGNFSFINRHYRQQLNIDYEDAVKLCMKRDCILVCNRDTTPSSDFETVKLVNIYSGRVILPSEWVQQHRLRQEDFVFQFLTAKGVLILPEQKKLRFSNIPFFTDL